jgi:hypothetical protein
MQAHHTTYAERGTSALVRPLTPRPEYRVISMFIGLPLLILGTARVDCLAVTSPTTDIKYTVQVADALGIQFA